MVVHYTIILYKNLNFIDFEIIKITSHSLRSLRVVIGSKVGNYGILSIITIIVKYSLYSKNNLFYKKIFYSESFYKFITAFFKIQNVFIRLVQRRPPKSGSDEQKWQVDVLGTGQRRQDHPPPHAEGRQDKCP